MNTLNFSRQQLDQMTITGLRMAVRTACIAAKTAENQRPSTQMHDLINVGVDLEQASRYQATQELTRLYLVNAILVFNHAAQDLGYQAEPVSQYLISGFWPWNVSDDPGDATGFTVYADDEDEARQALLDERPNFQITKVEKFPF